MGLLDGQMTEWMTVRQLLLGLVAAGTLVRVLLMIRSDRSHRLARSVLIILIGVAGIFFVLNFEAFVAWFGGVLSGTMADGVTW